MVRINLRGPVTMFFLSIVVAQTGGSREAIEDQTPTASNDATSSLVPAPTHLSRVHLCAPLSAAQAKDAVASWFNFQRETSGKLIYAFDTAGYGPAGFSKTWESYIVLREFKRSINRHDSPTHVNENDFLCYPVEVPYGYLYEPRFSPDAKYVTFKVGDPDSASGTYQLILWDLETQQLRVLHRSLNYRSVFWSYDSSYVAFVEGAVEPPLSGGWIPGKLHILNVRTNEDRIVTDKEPVLNSIAWSPENTLLYSQLPSVRDVTSSSMDKQLDGKVDRQSGNPNVDDRKTRGGLSAWRYQVYEVSPSGGDAKPIISDGYRALPSPDGRWIAFFGLPSPSQNKLAAPLTGDASALKPVQSADLMVCDREGQNRTLVRHESKGVSRLLWAPDSHALIMMKRIYKDNQVYQVKIATYDVTTHEVRSITAAEYTMRPGTDMTEDNPLFRPLRVSNDGKYLFFELLQFEAIPNNGLFLKAVNLADGSISTLCRIGSVRGLDWHDESTPVSPAAAKP